MEMNFEELLDKMTEFIKTEANTKTVVGESFTVGEFTCVPVVKIGMGFGSGGGSGDAPKTGKGQGGGAGLGMGIQPMGFLVTRENEISFLSTGKNSKGLSAMFEKIPDLMENIIKKKDKAGSE